MCEAGIRGLVGFLLGGGRGVAVAPPLSFGHFPRAAGETRPHVRAGRPRGIAPAGTRRHRPAASPPRAYPCVLVSVSWAPRPLSHSERGRWGDHEGSPLRGGVAPISSFCHVVAVVTLRGTFPPRSGGNPARPRRAYPCVLVSVSWAPRPLSLGERGRWGGHEGLPLRGGVAPPLSFGHFPRERGQSCCPPPLATTRDRLYGGVFGQPLGAPLRGVGGLGTIELIMSSVLIPIARIGRRGRVVVRVCLVRRLRLRRVRGFCRRRGLWRVCGR